MTRPGGSPDTTVRDRKRTALLEALRVAASPVPSECLRAELASRGIASSERSVRLYLAELCTDGLAEADGRRGYRVTGAGLAELKAVTAFHRLGVLAGRMTRLSYCMDFSLSTRRGSVVVDAVVTSQEALQGRAGEVVDAFSRSAAPGEGICLLAPGERIGEVAVPEGAVGVCTVSSGTTKGVLLKMGIPVRSRFGGVLELFRGVPVRVADRIHYDATTVDPLEALLLGGLLDPLGALGTGRRRVGVEFVEIPAEGRNPVALLAPKLGSAGLGSIVGLGSPGRPLFEVPAEEGYTGVVVAGGLNPLSVLWETGNGIRCRAYAGLLDYQRLFHYSALPDRLSDVPWSRRGRSPTRAGSLAGSPREPRRILPGIVRPGCSRALS